MQKDSIKQNKILGDIFIPTSNRLDALKQCIDSLSVQSDKRFRIILVGKNQDQRINNLVSTYHHLNILYIIQKKPGIIGAANQALRLSKGKIFSRIDDDVILDKNWFKNVITTFDCDTMVGGVTGPTTMSKEGLKSRDLTKTLDGLKNTKNPIYKFFKWIYFDYLYENKIFEVSQFLDSGVFTIGSNYPQSKKLDKIEVNNLEACNWSSRTSLLKKIGGFDKLYLIGLGDYHEADAALKIHNLGYKLIFNPKVALRHNVEIGKVENARPHSFYRIQNFIFFYFRFFKIKSFGQLIKFLTNLFLQNSYYVYKFITTGNIPQLYAIPGTFVGLTRLVMENQIIDYDKNK